MADGVGYAKFHQESGVTNNTQQAYMSWFLNS